MSHSIESVLIRYICLKGYHFERPSNIFLFQLSAADVVLLISMVTQQFYESPKNFPFQQSLCKAIYGTDCFAQEWFWISRHCSGAPEVSGVMLKSIKEHVIPYFSRYIMGSWTIIILPSTADGPYCMDYIWGGIYDFDLCVDTILDQSQYCHQLSP